MKAFLLAIALAVMVSGCSQVDTNAVTTLREYTIDGYITIVGEKGAWDGNIFKVTDYKGQIWDIPATANIEESRVDMDSFKKANRE